MIAPKCDLFYVPADNTAMAAAPTIVKVATARGIPVEAGDPGTFKAGCAFGVGVSYYDLGVQSAILADKVLRKVANAGDLPVVISGSPEVYVDVTVAQRLGITIPDSIRAMSRPPSE
jgi:putative ABC transport system substrate-binding protein